MRTSVAVITLIALGGLFSYGQGKTQRNSTLPLANAKHESPFACDRLALGPKERKRHFDELGPALRKLKIGVRELPDGYAFQFPTDPKTFQLLAEWVDGERLCCPFFEIEMRIEREGGPLWLRLTGRDGTKQFIQADAPDWVKQ
jgi:hypothetical protein